MLKLIDTSSFDYGDEPRIQIIDPSNTQGLVKSAADSRISEYAAKIRPQADRVYAHILAMGAGEYWGANRNGDYFPESNLVACHKTFETTPAHVFRNHVSKDVSIALGQVVFSVYNERMHRVEIIAWIDKNKGADVVRRIEQGDFPPTSMACRIPWDECSICGKQAHTRQEYCEHLASQLGRIYSDGRKVMALNIAPLKFHDISVVIRPADITSSVLQKVASFSPEPDRVIGSAELAELEGLVEKTAGFKKLSEFVKEIEDGGFMVDFSENLDRVLNKVKDPEYGIIPHLAKHDLKEVLTTFAHLGISPSLGYLAELIGYKLSGPDSAGIGDLVEGFVGNAGAEHLELTDKTFAHSEPHPVIADLLMPSVKQASLLPEFISERALSPQPAVHSLPGGVQILPGTNIGYRGNGPTIEDTPVERFRRLYGDPASHKPGGLMSMIKTLIKIGGMALATKWYITNSIEKKMQEASRNQVTHQIPPLKIQIVKSASQEDYRSTHHFAKCAMERVFKRPNS